MNIRNTRFAYGSVAKTLHWTIAALILLSYCSVYYRQWFTVEPDDWADWVGTPNYMALQIHLSIGVSIFALVILRILWRLTNPQPELPPGSRIQHLAAHAVHYVLYFFMILMPITGYFGTGADIDYLNVPQFRETALYNWLVTETLGIAWETFEKPVDFIHKKIGGAIVLWMLILIHAGAALYHHFVKRDDVLKRMLPTLHNDRPSGG